MIKGGDNQEDFSETRKNEELNQITNNIENNTEGREIEEKTPADIDQKYIPNEEKNNLGFKSNS
jgi:hypothetical protein